MDDTNSTKNQQQQQQRKVATDQLEELLYIHTQSHNRPKNLGTGIKQGLSTIITSALGACGVAVILPSIGLLSGLQVGGCDTCCDCGDGGSKVGGKVMGGLVGITVGGLLGILGATAIAVTGAVTGVVQLSRGVASVPASITAPRQGRWWNEHLGQWILTNMADEAELMKNIPLHDEDILGPVQADLDASIPKNGEKVGVAEMFYYDCLEVPASVEPAVLKRQYYLLARK